MFDKPTEIYKKIHKYTLHKWYNVILYKRKR